MFLRSSSPSPTQSTAAFEVTLACSEPCPFAFWMFAGMEIPQPAYRSLRPPAMSCNSWLSSSPGKLDLALRRLQEELPYTEEDLLPLGNKYRGDMAAKYLCQNLCSKMIPSVTTQVTCLMETIWALEESLKDFLRNLQTPAFMKPSRAVRLFLCFFQTETPLSERIHSSFRISVKSH